MFHLLIYFILSMIMITYDHIILMNYCIQISFKVYFMVFYKIFRAEYMIIRFHVKTNKYFMIEFYLEIHFKFLSYIYYYLVPTDYLINHK